MKKQFFTIFCILNVCVFLFCGCQNEKTSKYSNADVDTANESQDADDDINSINKPTIVIDSICTVSEIKDKKQSQISKILGNAIDSNNNTYTYKKGDYKFEATFYENTLGRVKIIPQNKLVYPYDGANILNVLGINNASQPDIISPSALVWENKFDTYKISVVSDEKDGTKVGYAVVILDQKYEQ